MLHPEQVGQFLLHENPYVRDHALRSLSLAESHGGVSVDVALDAIDKYGANAFAHADSLVQMPMSERAMQRLLAIAADNAGRVYEWFEKLPQAALKQYASRFPRELRDELAHRLALGELPPEKLWAQLDPLEECGLEIMALVEHDEFVAPRVLSILARPDDPMQYLAIELAGLCHIGSAMPLLLDRFALNDVATDCAIEAVARLGTAGAVTAIEQRCARGDAHFRTAAADCLACIRVPSVEPVLQRLMIEEDDVSVLGAIVEAMADICTTTNFDAICQAVRSGKATIDNPDAVKRALGALAIMLGRPLAEQDAWLTHRPRSISNLAVALRHGEAAVEELPEALGLPGSDNLGMAEQADVPAKTSPIRRQQAKVGRNDPCPCGSGKKYKKCCGA